MADKIESTYRLIRAKKMKQRIPPGLVAVFTFRPDYPHAQCVGISVRVERGECTVESITISGVEQLLGEGVPAEFLRTMPLQLDRQTSSDELVVTLRNHGVVEVEAEIVASFDPVESIVLTKQRMH